MQVIRNFVWITNSKYLNSKNIIYYFYSLENLKRHLMSLRSLIQTHTMHEQNVLLKLGDLFQEHPIYTRSPVLSRICTTNTMVLCTVLYELLPLQSLSFIPHSSSVSHPLQLHAHIIQHSILTVLLIFFFCCLFLLSDNVSLYLVICSILF